MENEQRPYTPHPWGNRWESIEAKLFYVPAVALCMHVLGLFQRDLEMLQLAGVLWTIGYLPLSPLLAWSVKRREPPGDFCRAAAYLIYGAIPLGLIVWPQSVFMQWPAAIVTGPLVMAIGGLAQIQAARDEPPPSSRAFRTWGFAGAAILCGATALPLFGGAGIGFLMMFWEPPKLAWLIGPLLMGVGLPLAGVYAYTGVNLARAAARAWREP